MTFNPQGIPLYHFRFLKYRGKTADFQLLASGIEIIRRHLVNRDGALTR